MTTPRSGAAPLSPAREQEIREAVPTVYGPPWTVDPDMEDGTWRVLYATDHPLAGLVAQVPDYGSHLAEFIAIARAAVPELLDEIERLREELDQADREATLREAAGAITAFIEADRARFPRRSNDRAALGAAREIVLGLIGEPRGPAGRVAGEKDTVGGSQPLGGESTSGPSRVECSLSVQAWWCLLEPGHSGGCIPRRVTATEVKGPAEPAVDPAERRDRYAAAMAKRDGDTWPTTYEGDEVDYRRRSDAAIVVADAEQAELRRERDLAIAHDRQPYPTAWAYEQACKALRRKTEAIEKTRALHQPAADWSWKPLGCQHDGEHGAPCRGCRGACWPCPTYEALGDAVGTPEAVNRPLVVARYDTAIEPMPDEAPVLIVGAVDENGLPVALLFDQDDRRKVADWLAPEATELLERTHAFELPWPGRWRSLLIERSYAGGDRWAICDREGRRWHFELGWVYEQSDLNEKTRTDTRFPLTEAWKIAHRIANGEG